MELKLLAVSLDRAPRHNWNSLIAAFARQTDDRIRLYAPDGTRIADGFEMEAPRYELRDPATEPWQRHAARAMDKIIDRIVWRAEERRGGKEGGSTGRSRWW